MFSFCELCVLSGNGIGDGDDDDNDEGDGNTADGEAVHGDVVVEAEASSGAHTMQQVEGEPMQHVEEDAGDVADFVTFDSGTPLHACTI
jgi:hypothetical protein